ncbi:hypothetical protein H7J86_26070 [Mycobacterium hackensackense]|uniref:hypothetical protein n=1 Tax=Mycobacterium hackensackense TaxID=228909 RepID=UPI002265878C|nr:hypothetical protein [Mycobacterium hackensackense]MCV7255635.1 hypothetical protein [Mycobacterium hackensackense]
MGWGGDYRTPEEQTELDAQRDAAAEAQLRSRLSHYERRTLDTLTDIATSVAAIAEVFVSINERDIASQHETNDADVEERAAAMYYAVHGDGAPPWENLPLTPIPGGIRDLFTRMSRASYGLPNPGIAAGDGGDVSAGPGDPSGPARPENDHRGYYNSREHCGHLWAADIADHECYAAAGHESQEEIRRHRCLCGATTDVADPN